MSLYADTSFLVSLYTPDTDSAKAAHIMAQSELPVVPTSFGELELVNAIELRTFRKELTRFQVKQALAMFHGDIASGVYFLKLLSATVFDRALQLARKHMARRGTRNLDILHVASALDLHAKTFYTFDHRQTGLAKAAGLRVLS